jgi:hypothetical protein
VKLPLLAWTAALMAAPEGNRELLLANAPEAPFDFVRVAWEVAKHQVRGSRVFWGEFRPWKGEEWLFLIRYVTEPTWEHREWSRWLTWQATLIGASTTR